MPSCVICIDVLKSPVALPCGHVFCHSCIERVVSSIKPFTTTHCCPTCRSPYTIASLDNSLVPVHLRPYISSPIRKIFLDPASETCTPAQAESASVRAENLALRAHCEAWRRRAEVHSAANLGLVNLARLARDHALQMKAERDALEETLTAMKRKYEGVVVGNKISPPVSSDLRPSQTIDILPPSLSRKAIAIPESKEARSEPTITEFHPHPSTQSFCEEKSQLEDIESERPSKRVKRSRSPSAACESLPSPTSPRRRRHPRVVSGRN
ncbi:hypothetical protein JAAARDRAFT_511597 [Jaapia argillacea MUCL 33604]|uniref:RING-type domain-containing protein n=1 Tax=Jaapia argillacea MUCL 33604 TaxID=933084 RepID=A0A067QDB7_9AGAM|nr:hypothetical protein JAAARDRAFT_511597 [Jaapia argillacea MUCL 33604]